ncbi:MAG: transporter associated domain-containing protein, partial [Planctomycetota bacterium]
EPRKATDDGGGEESIVASIGLRMLRPSQMDDLAEAAESVIYVPWSSRVSQVLDQLQSQDRNVAVVVNEFGDEVGALSLDGIWRRMLSASYGPDDETRWIKRIDDVTVQVTGATALSTLAREIGVEVPEERNATVAGLLQRHNERFPRLGDAAPLDNHLLQVIEESDDRVLIEVRPATIEEESEGDAADSDRVQGGDG